MSAAPFDVHDRSAWYFGQLSRQEAAELLMQERDGGVFLVRDSNTSAGDYVLCVKEDLKVSHYIINKVQLSSPSNSSSLNGDSATSASSSASSNIVYRIGDQSFADLPELLAFYILHYLDTTPLRRPLARRLERVVGKFDFEGSDADDLPFKKGELLHVVNKDEDQWWTARNALGQVGQIPVPYVQKFDESSAAAPERPGSGGPAVLNHHALHSAAVAAQQSPGGGGSSSLVNSPGLHQADNTLKKSNLNRKLPAYARVKQARVPNAYDKTALKLEVGDIIMVTKTNINGQWEGDLKGKTGHFPFTHVEFIEPQLAPPGGGGDGAADDPVLPPAIAHNHHHHQSPHQHHQHHHQSATMATTTTGIENNGSVGGLQQDDHHHHHHRR